MCSDIEKSADALEPKPTGPRASSFAPAGAMIALAALLVGMTATPLEGQGTSMGGEGPWSLELRSGAGVQTGDLGDSELGTGFGFEATVGYRFMPHLGVYLGWDWYHFTADGGGFVDPDSDVEETGYAFGLRFQHPLGDAPVDLWLRAGGTYNHIELEDGSGDITADSGHEVGFEGGAGFAFGLAETWIVTPGVRFRTLSNDFEFGSATNSVDLSYLALELGLLKRF